MKIITDSKTDELRRKLQKIVDKYENGELDEQINEIERIRLEFNHSIMLENKINCSNRLSNCYMQAFEFEPFYPDSCFVNYLLIENVFCELEKNVAKDGDYVIYFSEDYPRHAGVKDSVYVKSKWGGSNIWKHKIEEVPIKYGDEVRFYQKIEYTAFKKIYVKFLQTIW